MSYTANMRSFDAGLADLRSSITVTEDALLDLRDHEKRVASLAAESDDDLADKYGLEQR